MIDPSIMDARALLPQVLLLFGVGFLLANLRAGLDIVRFLRRRRRALLIWPGRRPAYFGLIVAIGVTLGLLIIVKIAVLQRSPAHVFGEGMMFVYYAVAVPLTRLIGRGFYQDGVWSEQGFMPYQQIGGIAWREGEQLTLLLISRVKQFARPLVVPGAHYGAVRRLLRDKIADHDIQFNGAGLDLGQDERDKI
jgi:hypothetical protein